MARGLLRRRCMSMESLEHADVATLIARVLADHGVLRHELHEATLMAGQAGADDLVTAIAGLARELHDHMLKEERVLLPWIRAGRGATAGGPIRAMILEHELTLAWLTEIRELTGGHRAPTEALAPLYRRLAELERFLVAHIALENDVLFPRALAS